MFWFLQRLTGVRLVIGERLKLIKLDYEFRRVRVIFIKDYPGLPTPTGLLDVKKGDELELPRWQARLLREEGYVELRDVPVDLEFINMYHYKERKGSTASQLSQIPQDFYVKAAELIEKLDRLIKETPSQVIIRDREVAERNLVDIAEARLAKIIRFSYTGGEEFREKMSPEERIIYNHVVEAVEAWRSYLKELVARGGTIER